MDKRLFHERVEFIYLLVSCLEQFYHKKLARKSGRNVPKHNAEANFCFDKYGSLINQLKLKKLANTTALIYLTSTATQKRKRTQLKLFDPEALKTVSRELLNITGSVVPFLHRRAYETVT